METDASRASSTKRRVVRHFWLLLPLIVALVIGSFVYINSRRGTFTACAYNRYTEGEFAEGEVTVSDPNLLEVTSITRTSRGKVRIVVKAVGDGEATLSFVTPDAGEDQETWFLRARKDGVIFARRGLDLTVSFEGWEAILASVTVLFGALSVLFAAGSFELWRASWYGYTMVICVAGFLFCFFQFLFFAFGLINGVYDNFDDMAFFVSNMVMWFVFLSGLPMSVLAVLVSLSNVSLIRHEGKRLVNLLGIGASVVWAAFYLTLMFTRISFEQPQHTFLLLLYLVVAYGECLLLAVMLCAWLAARHVPKHALDYLIILGCGIRDDGTPCPLLAGRVDRAVDFDEEWQAKGDDPCVFVPSGGKGDDEVISEALSMANYLVDHRGVERSRIELEDRSVRTSENMRFSREVIERRSGHDASELSVGFSTTNYHVFRGYVCAHQAGMAVEGMGSRTKYYFWPNAFLREFVGLIVARWKALLLLFIITAVIYVLLGGALSLYVQNMFV